MMVDGCFNELFLLSEVYDDIIGGGELGLCRDFRSHFGCFSTSKLIFAFHSQIIQSPFFDYPD